MPETDHETSKQSRSLHTIVNGDEVTHLSHSSINEKVRSIHETALITRKKQYSLCLFNGFTKPTSRKMDLPTMALRGIIAKPIL